MKRVYFYSFLSGLLIQNIYADESILNLETIHVSTENHPAFFYRIMGKKDIAHTPKGNNSIDGLLQTNPSIQFSSSFENSEQLGEIVPANLSVHGESFYNNHFAIDGLNNNANLNPAHNDTNPLPDADTINSHTPNQLPAGHTQSFWISNQSIQKLKVMDSNIPAKYGRFTGGYIDATLLEPQLNQKSSGSISYRQTRHNWVKFYLDEAYEEEFKKGISPDTQPQFLKQQFHVDINQPIGEKSALLFAYDREESKIPLYHQHLNIRTKQKRLAETFYLKGIHQLNENNLLSAGFIYSPHQAVYFPENIKDGRYINSGGGWRLNFNWDNQNHFGNVQTQLAYRRIHETTAYDQQNLYRYHGNTPNVPWVSFARSQEATLGGLGTTKTFQNELTLKQDWEFQPIENQDFSQQWSAGWTFNYNQAGLKRNQASRIYAGSAPTDEKDCTDCIPGEQYFTWLAHIHPVNGKVSNNSASLWAENQLNWDKFQLNLGLRADYNQFLKNINFAPRMSFKKDFGNQGFYLSGGVNRYYGAEILTYQLASAFKDQDNYNRSFNHDPKDREWSGKPQMFLGYNGSELKTPYSDELNFALGQTTNYFNWEAKWVRRFSRDQFMTKRYEDDAGRVVRELNNSGRNHHDTFSLTFDSLQPWQLGKVEFSLNAGLDYQRHKSNQQNQTFNESEWWKDYDVQKMMVDGKLYSPNDMPALNHFNRPWGGYLATKLSVPEWHFTWEQRFRYEAPRKFYEQTNLRCKNAVRPQVVALCAGYAEGNLSRYDSIHYSSSILTDWHFSWEKPLNAGRSIELNVDILNVFNRKIVGKRIITEPWQKKQRDVSYKPGRQFWFGWKYQW